MSEQSEQILIKRCKDGDLQAFEELISKYETKVFNITFRILGDYTQAEDVSQDIMVKVFRTIKGFKEQSSFYTWLYRITVNECMDMVKKRKRTLTYSIDSPLDTEDGEIKTEIQDSSESVEGTVERNELRRYLADAMNSLSPEHKTVIVLRDVQGFSYEEIAEIIKCPPGTVKSRINRARLELKNLLMKNRELFLSKSV
ncbi:MAG: RNA polymerase sigma factor [Deltaproteobacteria bacterium]